MTASRSIALAIAVSLSFSARIAAWRRTTNAAPSSPQLARPAIASTAATGAFQSIVGMDKEKLTDAMAAFKSGARSSSIMHAVALSFSDAEIATLAEYLAAQPAEIKRQ